MKDLAEAEEKCWKAEYYRSVVGAMKDGSSGYGTMGARSGYGTIGQQGQQMRSGYSSEQVEQVRKMMHGITPEDRERLVREFM